MGLDTNAAKGTAGSHTLLQTAWSPATGDSYVRPVPLDGTDEDAREAFAALDLLIPAFGGRPGAGLVLGGIRGKHYAGLVMEASGVDLFSSWTLPQEAAAIARKMRAGYDADRDAEDSPRPYRYLMYDGTTPGSPLFPGEYGQLVRFFEVAAEHGYGLYGTW